MNIASRSLFVLAVHLAMPPVLASADTSSAPPAMFGYYDPSTRVFTPAPPGTFAGAVPQPATGQATKVAAPIVRSGTVTITATVHLVSSIPTNASFYTNMQIGVADPPTAPPPSYSSSAEAFNPTVTRSGSVVTVKAVIPYRFVYTVAADKMTVSFNISYDGGTYPRFSFEEPIAVPAAGANTAVALAATL